MPSPEPNPGLDPFDGAAVRALRWTAGLLISGCVGALVRIEDSGVPDGLPGGARPLLVTNHRSPLDYFIVVAVCRSRGYWPAMFAREDFFYRRTSRYALRSLALIPAARGRGVGEGLIRAGRMLDQGQVVAIAAEGGLIRAQDTPDGVGRLRSGAGRLADAGADVTVLTILGAEAAWAPGSARPRLRMPWRRPQVTVRARSLPPLARISPREATRAIRVAMVELAGER